jgi:class 3 adenylate cyclase/tetratricopeptide (TPR) repeat protein
VLFADLVGFTTLSESKDPEEVRELLSRYFATSRTIIGRYGGVVEKFIGDAVMAVWGTPVAVEGDAERAVRAGLDLVAAVSALGAEMGVTDLGLRAGVVTGEVAAAVGAVGEGMVAGDAVNTAARVQGAATSGTVWVDEPTQRLASAGIGFQSVGAHELKGKSDRVELWQATRVHSNVGGTQRVDGLEAPMIGREAEDRTLRELFHLSADRRVPRLVVVSGGPGTGKSRLGWEFEKYVDGLAKVVNWHRGRCLSYGDGVAYWALAEAVRQRFGIAEEDSLADATNTFLEGLERFVPDADQRAYVGVRLGRLLGLNHPDDSGASLGHADLFAGWRLFLEQLADEAPVVLLIEDAEHADDALLDFFEHVVDWARQAPIFIVLFGRTELTDRRPGLGIGRNRSSLTLDPLDEPSMRSLVTALVRDLPGEAVEAIVQQAEGNPLFAVETIRSLIDRDVIIPREGEYRLVGDVGTLSVPDSLHALLAARLDALDGDLRALGADASVLGSTFPGDALTAVSGRRAGEVGAGLAELVRRGVFQISSDPLSPQRGSYAFSQNMLRQVAYDTLSRRDRRARHLAVAEHLQHVFAAGGDEVMDVIAQHYLDALEAVSDGTDPEVTQRAFGSLVRAAERSERAGAQARAARSFQRAAGLVADTDALEAARLWERSSQGYEAAGHYDEAHETAARARETYLDHDQPRAAARTLALIGRTFKNQGRMSEARTALEEALAELRPAPDVDTVLALREAAGVAAFSGRPEGRPLADEALGLGQGLDVPLSEMAELFSTMGIADIFNNRRLQATASLQFAAELAERAGDSGGQARALLNLSAALLAHDAAASAAAARRAADLGRLSGHRLILATAASNLAVAKMCLGHWDEALSDLDGFMRDDGLDDDAVVFLNIPRAILLGLRGELEEARALAALEALRETEDVQDLGMISWMDAVLAAESGDPEGALEHARTLFEPGSQLDLSFEPIFWSWPLAVQCAFEIQDVDEVRRLVQVLGDHPSGSMPPLLNGSRTIAHARLAALDGEAPSTVDDSFADGIAILRSAASPFHLGHGLLDHAAHLRATGSDASADLDEAVLIAERLGAASLRQRAEALGALVPMTT